MSLTINVTAVTGIGFSAEAKGGFIRIQMLREEGRDARADSCLRLLADTATLRDIIKACTAEPAVRHQNERGFQWTAEQREVYSTGFFLPLRPEEITSHMPVSPSVCPTLPALCPHHPTDQKQVPVFISATKMSSSSLMPLNIAVSFTFPSALEMSPSWGFLETQRDGEGEKN